MKYTVKMKEILVILVAWTVLCEININADPTPNKNPNGLSRFFSLFGMGQSDTQQQPVQQKPEPLHVQTTRHQPQYQQFVQPHYQQQQHQRAQPQYQQQQLAQPQHQQQQLAQPQYQQQQHSRDLPFGSGPCQMPATTTTTPLPFIPLCPVFPQPPPIQPSGLQPPYFGGLVANPLLPLPETEEEKLKKKKKKKPTGEHGVAAADQEIEEGEEAEAVGPAVGPFRPIQIGPGFGRPVGVETNIIPVIGPALGVQRPPPGMFGPGGVGIGGVMPPQLIIPEELAEKPGFTGIPSILGPEFPVVGPAVGGIQGPAVGPSVGGMPGVGPAVGGMGGVAPIGGPVREPGVGPPILRPPGPVGPPGALMPAPPGACPSECTAMANAVATATAHAEASARAAEGASATAKAIAEATATATAQANQQAVAEAVARATAEARAVAEATASAIGRDAVAKAIAEAHATATATAGAAGLPGIAGALQVAPPCQIPSGCPVPNANCPGQVPFTPPGFNFVNPYNAPKIFPCSLGPLPPDVPRCNTLDMMERLQLRVMSRLIRQAGLEPLFEQTDNYTFFGPVDQAFLRLPEWFLESLNSDMKLLRAFILQHYIKIDLPLETIGNEFLILNARPGGNRLRFNVYFPENSYRVYTVDGSKVVLGNVETRNAHINVMNKVLVPNPPRNAAQYLQEVPEFQAFMSAVLSSDCLSILQGPDPVTVFAPANIAFETFDLTSLKTNATAISNFVRYHVVPGVWYSEGLVDGQYLTTLYDKELKVSVSTDGLTKSLTFINSMNRIIKGNIPVLNGVVHVIDSVLSSRDFYFYPHLSEFSVMEFGAMRRSGFEDPFPRTDENFLQRVNNHASH